MNAEKFKKLEEYVELLKKEISMLNEENAARRQNDILDMDKTVFRERYRNEGTLIGSVEKDLDIIIKTTQKICKKLEVDFPDFNTDNVLADFPHFADLRPFGVYTKAPYLCGLLYRLFEKLEGE